MNLDIQKASVLKRISAGILDFILLIVLAVGCCALLSLICDFDGHIETYQGYLYKYEKEFLDPDNGKGFDYVNTEEFKNLPEEDQQEFKEKCDKAYEALNADDAAVKEFAMVMSLSLVVISIGIFLSYLILEFILPLIFKNGQTIGKKVFGIALMHTNSVKVNSVAMFIRSILGKYVIETMIPVLIVLMMYFNVIGIVSIIVLAGILILEIIVYIVSKNGSLIHDILAKTIAVDLASQMIYSTQEEMLEATRVAQYESEHPEYVPGTFSFDKTTDGEKIDKADAIPTTETRTDIVIVDEPQDKEQNSLSEQ